MGVNAAVVREHFIKRRRSGLSSDIVLPVLGFLFCFGIWISLPKPAKIAGGIWLLAGVVYLAIRTRGFRRPPARLNFE
jgi:hypothetical protein